MSNEKLKHITALAAWALLQGYYLAFHFSWYNFALFVLAILYLLYTTVLSKKQEKTHVVSTLGNLLGTTFALLLGYYVMTSIVPEFIGTENILALLQVKLVASLDLLKMKIQLDKIHMLILAALLVVFFFAKRSTAHPLLSILFRYLFTVTIIAPFIQLIYGSWKLSGLFLLITMVFISCDILAFQHIGFRPTAGKRWFNILGILLLAVIIIKPEALAPFVQKGFLEYYFVICGFKWYTALFIFAVLLAATVLMIILGAKAKVPKTCTDAFVFFNAICVLVTLFFMTRFYVGYWWIIAILYGGCLAFTITTLHPVKAAGNEAFEKLEILFFPGVSIVTVILTVAGHYGRLLLAIAFLTGLIPAFKIWDGLDEDESNWKKKAWFYIFLLLWIGLTVAAALWCFKRLTLSFLILLGVFCVCSAFIWIVSFDSGLFSAKGQIVRIATVFIFAVICLSLCVKCGSKVVVKPDDNNIPVVTVTAKGKDNEIQSVEYYWLDDYLLLDKQQEGYPKEIQLTDTDFPETDGRLRVLATDKYGIQTEQAYWVHLCQYVDESVE